MIEFSDMLRHFGTSARRRCPRQTRRPKSAIGNACRCRLSRFEPLEERALLSVGSAADELLLSLGPVDTVAVECTAQLATGDFSANRLDAAQSVDGTKAYVGGDPTKGVSRSLSGVVEAASPTSVATAGDSASSGSTYLYWDPDPDYFIADQDEVHFYWDLTDFTPADAYVTNVEYRLWLGEEDPGETDFYCGDYWIQMYTDPGGAGHVAWANDGGWTDEGMDDDVDDDYDIYLNWRSTSDFNGQPVAQTWSWDIWDNYAGDDGNVDYIEYYIYWESEPLPDAIGDTLSTAEDTGLGPGTYVFEDHIGGGTYGDLDVDIYEFYATSGDPVTAETSLGGGSSSMDTILRLFDASGTELTYSDDYSGLYSRIDYTIPSSGWYYVGVSGYNNFYYDPNTGGSGWAGSTGDYRLDLDVGFDLIGDTLSTAEDTGLGPGTYAFEDHIGGGTYGDLDVDIYEFYATSGDLVTAETSLGSGSTSMDTILTLFDASGTELTYNDDYSGLYSRIDYTIPSSGWYYVGVSGYDNFYYDPNTGGSGWAGSTGDYRLDLHVGFDLIGDTLSTAEDTGLGPGTYAFEDHIGGGTYGDLDVDIYEFYATSGDRVTAETSLGSGSTSMDTILTLFDASGTELTYNDDYSGLYSRIDYTIPSSGWYYVGVSGYDNFYYDPNTGGSGWAGSTGDYRLDLDVGFLLPDLIGDTLSTAEDTGLGPGTYAFEDHIGGGTYGDLDVDIYEFYAISGASVTAETSLGGGSSSMDTILRLFDASGAELTYNDDYSGLYSRIDYTILSSGWYYVGVSGYANFYYDPNTGGSGWWAGSTGDYRLDLDVTFPPDIGDTMSTAEPTGLGVGTYSNDSMIGDGNWPDMDVDMYRIEATAGDRLEAETSLPVGGAAMDTMLRVFDSLGNQVAIDDDGGGDPYYSRIEYEFPSTGAYYVGVSGYPNDGYDPANGGSGEAGSTGDYRLDLWTYAPGQIRGSKWNDLNGDGEWQTDDEPGLPGWHIYLDLNCNGQWDELDGEPDAWTDANGDYVIGGLAPGTYIVAEELQGGWVQTYPGGAVSAPVEVSAGQTEELGQQAAVPALETNPFTHYEPFAAPELQGVDSLAGLKLDLPAAYDLRDYGMVTPVKNQGSCGSCWTFATYGSLESSILMESGPTRDLSENHLKNYHGFDWGPCDGGNYWISQAYLSRWSGPVDESDDPYHDYDDRPSPGGPAQYYVRESLVFDTPTEIKNAVMTYGGLYTSFQWDSNCYNSGDYTYYCTYYGGNHAVTIVGWDDAKVVTGGAATPPGPGAWLIKNSWGTGWGNNGYFWISYYDVNLTYGTSFCDAVPPDDFSSIYYYDDFGDVTSVNYDYAFNAFTATAYETLAAVQFFTQVDGAGYDLRIYDDYDGSLSNLLAETTGTCSARGYHTVDLPSSALIASGDDFYVYLDITDGGDYPQTVDYAYPGYSSASTASPGESYYSFDGITWADLTTGFDPTANFCIKVLTTVVSIPGTHIVLLESGNTIDDVDFGNYAEYLAWDELGDANWGDLYDPPPDPAYSHWVDPDGNPVSVCPDAHRDAIIRTDTVTVASDCSARNLSIESGGYHVVLDGPTNGCVDASGDADLGGELSLTAIARSVGIGSWADETRIIITAAGGVNGMFAAVPSVLPATHLGNGVFFKGVTYGLTTVTVDVLQAWSGDCNGDHIVDFSDFVRLFNNWTGTGGTGKDWTQGDFTGDGAVDFSDFVQLFNHWTGPGGYHKSGGSGGAAFSPDLYRMVSALAQSTGSSAYVRTPTVAAHDAVFTAEAAGQTSSSSRMQWLSAVDPQSMRQQLPPKKQDPATKVLDTVLMSA